MNRKLLPLLLALSGIWAQDVVFWEPEIPVPGGDITIYYNVVAGTLPNNANPVYIHLGYNGWENTNDYSMTPAPDIGTGWWKYLYNIPQNAETIDFVFTDLQGNWDNNGGIGIDWHISLNYYWTPYHPGPEETVSIVLNNTTQGGEIAWTINNGSNHVPPIEDYWPDGSYLEEELVLSPLGSNGENSLSIDIGPFLSGEQVVQSIKFKIRWDDGSWDIGSNGQVMYYDIYIDYDYSPGDPYVFFVSPTPDEGAQVSGGVSLSVVGDAETVEFWANGSNLGTDNASPYEATWTPEPSEFGNATIVVIAHGSEDKVTYLFRHVNIVHNIVEEPVPTGVTDGVNINGNTVTIALYAPFKDFVAIKGSWNQDFPNGELMKLSGDTLWWYQTELPDGTFSYQYNLEGEKTIADPWSKDVLWVDPGGGWESGNYSHAKTIFEIGAVPFTWTDYNFVRPVQEDVIVYELHVGDFRGIEGEIGTYQDIIQKLNEGYFTELGVTAIELLPVNEFEGSNSWGYNPTFYMAPETTYGTPDELKELVDTAHQHGIAILMDVVFNHMWGSAPLFQLYQPIDNYDFDDHNYDQCPYFHNQESQWGYKLEHWHEVNGRSYRSWKHITDVLLTWIYDYHIDGFRFDHTAGIGWGEDANGASYYADLLDDIDPSLILIAEEDNPSKINTTDFDAGWDYSYHHTIFDNLMEIYLSIYNLQSHFQWWSQSYSEHTGPLNYAESHDEPRLIYEAINYQGMTIDDAALKTKLGAVALLTGTGTPMIYHGQEFGQSGTSRDPNGHVIPQPLQWENLNSDWGNDIFTHYKRLLWLRNNRGVIRGPNLEVMSVNNSQKYITMKRHDDTLGQTVFIVMNFNSSAQTISNLGFPYAGDWFEFTLDEVLHTNDGSYANYEIPASTARVYTNYKDWEDLSVDDLVRPIPFEFNLEPNYPNPFNPVTVISYQLSADSDVSLQIYNVKGQIIKTLLNKTQRPGFYSVNWKPNNLPSGVYFCKLVQGSHSSTQKLILLK